MGTGVDVVRIDRIEKLLEHTSRRFEGRVFSAAEVVECRRDPSPARRFAECFALKEAALKAAGTGRAQGVRWSDVEAQFRSEGEGPILRFSGRVAEIVGERGANHWIAAVGGCRRFAVACVVLEARDA